MKKLGIDLGSASCGWAIREDDKIINKGVVTFSTGMKKGQGGYSSPTKDRREARSKRRLIQARKYRKWELMKILIEYGLVPLGKKEFEIWNTYKKRRPQKFPENERFLKWLACDFTYLENGTKYNNPYELRVKGIDEQLSNHEFGRVLYHLVQRRGYKDIGENDQETENQKNRREDTGFNIAMNSNRTIAEALTNDFLKKGKRARNEYPYRDEYQNELETICEGQGYEVSKNEKEKYTDRFVESLWKAIIWQRPLRSQKGNIGKCTLETNNPRCPVSHPVFEIFRAWQFINTIMYYNEESIKESLSQEYRELLFVRLFLTKDKNFKFEDVRKFLDKQFGNKKEYNYPINKKTGKYDTTIAGMPVCNGLIRIFGEKIKTELSTIHQYNIGNALKTINLKTIKRYSIYDIWHILFDFNEKGNSLQKFAVEKLSIEDEIRKIKGKEVFVNPLELLQRNMATGYSDLSLKAMRKIIPFLREGFLYNEAVILAKIPELINGDWEQSKNKVYAVAKKSNEIYTWHKAIIGITNNLIDKYKGLEHPNIFAYKDYDYLLDEKDDLDIKRACKNYFGEKTWKNIEDKENVIKEVGFKYQDFFHDTSRVYRKLTKLTDIFLSQLIEEGIELDGELYHHSQRANLYGYAEEYKKTGIKILPIPRIDSIKNPMFNKSMSILRKLINELIINGEIDDDTEVVVEVARDLNDNNKRAAIERYQKDREQKRNKIREFLKEFEIKENRTLNVEERISEFELWTEQVFEITEDENGKKVSNNNPHEILKEKEAIRRYELWMEQKGQCMYTGKMISITQLFSNQIDVEHTIPRSLLPDNTMANQTVCDAKYNRDVKNNQIPTQCPNYTEIKQRLDKWVKIRDDYKEKYEKNLRPSGNEDESMKNKRIQNKHYNKMYFEYWKDKVERFIADEIKDSWARRQLVDTQMVSKYTREFLKTYFKKVVVQKGSVTAAFRKIYGFQEQEEIKSRNKHTHHAIDAAVLTLIPANSSKRDKILNKMYQAREKEKEQYTTKPFEGFNSQKLIEDIENTTLIVNYEKDKIIQQTYRNVRKRGLQQYLKNDGSFVLDNQGDKIPLKAKGDSVRSSLYKQTFLGKIQDVELDDKGRPKRTPDNKDWVYKKDKNGDDVFSYVERKPIKDVLSNKIDDIVDPVIRDLVKKQKDNTDKQGNPLIKDWCGNIIRHVRIKVKSGREVKERLNYRSKHKYKNYYYAASDSIPYAALLQKKGERLMIPITSSEVAKVFKENKSFNIDAYLKMFQANKLLSFFDKKLLKVGQKVIVLNNDEEYEKRVDVDFQVKRMYKITQFKYDGSKILLQYHLEAQPKQEIDKQIKIKKDEIIKKKELELGIEIIKENFSMENAQDRKKDYEQRKYSFDKRLKVIEQKSDSTTSEGLKEEISNHKTESSSIMLGVNTPILGLTKKNWKFLLFEGSDFEISLTGKLKWFD